VVIAMLQRKPAWPAGFAVRRDWPDGSHDLVAFRGSAGQARRFARRDRAYWRRSPLRPLTHTVVVTSRRDVVLHAARHPCASPDCPTADPAAAHVSAAR